MLMEEEDTLNAARFLRHVEQTPGCWYWRGNLGVAGHGRVRVHGRLCSARRVAYELWIGSIPANSMVGTSCGEKACVRPEHMVLIEPVCVTRLTKVQISRILRFRVVSMELAEQLAHQWGVSWRHIYRIRRNAASAP